MTPGARLEAVMELLAAVEGSPRPADGVVAAWFRDRRFIGSKDRKAIHERLYDLMRRRAHLGWWLSRLQLADSPRARLLAHLALADHAKIDLLNVLFDGEKFHPTRLSSDERKWTTALEKERLDHAEMPDWVKYEYPEWLDQKFRARFGERFAEEMRALLLPARLDLRVNALKATREEAIAALALEGITATPTDLSPWGLRLPERVNLMASKVFKDGLVEVQDEGSQLVAQLVDAQPGMVVCDFCAGAGGKTLALASMMNNKGRLVACDVSEGRLLRSADRLKRAGVHNVTRHVLDAQGAKWLKRQAGSFDRVLVDAPCTGTGTWRRNPDAKWKLTPEDLSELTVKQAEILERASRLVKPGGRLVYVTCSLLAEENDMQIEAFLEKMPGFRLEPIEPGQDYLRLSPLGHGTDGFFAARLLRNQGI
ncbi:MAG: RsmB/NOP family class I SAM-dependent RNA methyltransferase [Alphaproteobacteria bacterium]|nr:RsmB/NOP family class I SAM-dependent RNA methyltransferase [Alphaproteobacteria bacterium]